MAMLETPSRIWRRIEAVEGKDMPSLPSLPHFDDSTESEASSDSSILGEEQHKRANEQEQEQRTQDDGNPLVTPHTRRRSFLIDVINSSARSRVRFSTPRPRKDGADSPGVFTSPDFYGATPRASAKRPPHPLAQTHLPREPSGSSAEADKAHRSASQSVSVSVSMSEAETAPFPPRLDAKSTPSPVTADNAKSMPKQKLLAPADNAKSTPKQKLLAPAENAKLTPKQKLLAPADNAKSTPKLKLPATPDQATSTPKQKPPATADPHERASSSFVSTASSHDLTTHHRVNTSFDPVIGLGGGGHGVGRFNAGKLNSYLHGLNRRLQEENEALLERLRKLEDEQRGSATANASVVSAESGRRMSGVIGHIDAAGVVGREPGDAIYVDMQGWQEEKAELVRRLGDLESEREDILQAQMDAERALDDEMAARAGDKDKWKERMAEVERGVEKIMHDLEQKLIEAEKRADDNEAERMDAERRAAEAEMEMTAARERAALAESTVERTSGAMGGELKEANTMVERLMGDLKDAKKLVRALEAELMESHERVDDLEKQWREANEGEEEALLKVEELQKRVTVMDQAAQEAEKDRDAVKEYLAGLEEDAGAAVDRIESLEAELAATQQTVEELEKAASQTSERLEKEAKRAGERVKQLEEALDVARAQIREHEEAIQLTTGIASQDRSGFSPAHRDNMSAACRTPKTPGGPLRDISWLNNKTGGPHATPLVSEISRLQHQLDRANDSIDDKLERLEEAGLGVVGLTKKLDDARSRITGLEEDAGAAVDRIKSLEAELAATQQTVEELEKAAGQTSERLEVAKKEAKRAGERVKQLEEALDVARAQIREHEEVIRLTATIASQDQSGFLSAHRDNMSVACRTPKTPGGPLRDISWLNDKTGGTHATPLVSEISRLQRQLDRANDSIDDKLERLEEAGVGVVGLTKKLEDAWSRITGLEEELMMLKQENRNLEAELRANANADQKSRLLEAKVAANTATIDQLREERSILAQEHKNLQCQFKEVSEHANRLRDEFAAAQAAHSNRRHQLDLYPREIDDLRRALSEQASELQRSEEEMARMVAEKTVAAETFSVLQGDLSRVKRDAEAFGRDLEVLKTEKEKLEVAHQEEMGKARREAQAQMKHMHGQLEGQRDKTRMAEEELERHVCSMNDRQLVAIKQRHNQECKGLIVQVRYLKAKYTRESLRRCMLVAQKDYMMSLLACFERSEKNIVLAISRVGFPLPPPQSAARRQRSFKTAVYCVLFTIHVRRASEDWKVHSASKDAVIAAYQEVRGRELIPRTTNKPSGRIS